MRRLGFLGNSLDSAAYPTSLSKYETRGVVQKGIAQDAGSRRLLRKNSNYKSFCFICFDFGSGKYEREYTEIGCEK